MPKFGRTDFLIDFRKSSTGCFSSKENNNGKHIGDFLTTKRKAKTTTARNKPEKQGLFLTTNLKNKKPFIVFV